MTSSYRTPIRAEGGPLAQAAAEAIGAWLEERVAAVDEEGMVAAEFEEKREELLAAAARDRGVVEAAGRDGVGEGKAPVVRDASAAGVVGGGVGGDVESGQGGGGGEEDEEVEVVFTVEEEEQQGAAPRE